jgi:hypothetical protein
MRLFTIVGCVVVALGRHGPARAESTGTVARAWRRRHQGGGTRRCRLVCPFGRSAREFNFMVQNGITAMQAIQSATVAGADLLGISDKVGSGEIFKQD